jgi:predicted ATPase/DNA-binding SARP family transcriptional activator
VVLQIALLGPLEVRLSGRRVQVPSGKASELLVRLALDAGEIVRADRLIDDLWTAGAMSTRRNTLESKVAMLRRALGNSDLIVNRDRGYTLVVEPSEVDALAAMARVPAATRLLDAGDDRGAAELAAATLELYRGDVLQTAGVGAWVEPYKARLEETRTKLLEIQFTARLRLGGEGNLIGELEAAVAAYPFHESLWELLITALYRAGRQADALAAYQRVRSQLADELGLDPRPELQQLEQLILTHDLALSVPVSDVAAVPEAPKGNLPSISADLVGRDKEVAALCDLLAAERLVEIVGSGGVGKTAVAIAVGRRLSLVDVPQFDGIWLARLETATTADDVVDVLVAAVNVPGGEPALLERLKGTAPLVILDNCEHVVDAAAALAMRLLDAAPGLRMLCTSQVPLGVDGEAVVELPPLPLSDAVLLFMRRAIGQRPHPTSTIDAAAVLDLCRSLDGLPLAIELAAARTRTLSIEDITRRLGNRFGVLSDPTSRRPERRRSLRSTIRWSYELLFPDDQRGLWALAAFAGGATLPALEFVLEALEVPAGAAIDVIGRLASRSLLIVYEDQGAVRYRLLDSIRAFALEAMTDAGTSEVALAAHADWFANAAGFSTRGVRSGHQAEHLAFARAERANIDAALAWSVTHDPLLAVHIVNGFGWAWVVLGDTRGAQRILTALDAAGDAGPPQDRASALLLASWIEASTGNLEPARNHVAVATELAETTQDLDLQARCLYYLAYVVSHSGEFRFALELTARSNALYDTMDRPWDQAASWLFAARAAISAGDQERSVEAAAQVQRWVDTLEDPWLRVRTEAMLGELARIQHRFDDAVSHISGAAETSRRLGFQQTEAYQVMSLGRAQCQAGNYSAGAATLELAVDKAEATGDPRLAALARVHLGRVLRALGQLARARTVLAVADEWHRSSGGGEQAALGECLLATMDAADEVPGAAERLTAILSEARRRDDATLEVFALDALARTAASAGDIGTALGLCEAADRRMETVSHFITDLDRTDARWVRRVPKVPPVPRPGHSDSHAGGSPGRPAIRL